MVGFLFVVFQARFLGTAIKGQVATVNSIVAITSILFDLGISQAYPYFKRNSNVNVIPILIKIAFIPLIFGIAASIAAVVYFDISAKYIAVMILTSIMVYEGIVSYITLIENPNKRHWFDVYVMFMELVFVIALWAFAQPNFFLGILIISMKYIMKAVMCTFELRKNIFHKTESIFKWIPKLVKFGFFPMLSLLMSTLNYRVGIIMMDGRVADAAIGIYSVGITLAERIWLIPDAIKGVMTSRLTKGKDEQEVTLAIRLCNTGCLLLICGIVLLGKPFITFIFGSEYREAYGITMLLLFGVFSMIYYKIISSYNTVMGKQRISFIFLSIAASLNYACCFILIPPLGIYGAGISSVTSYALCGILFIAHFCKCTKVPIRDVLIIKREDFAVAKSFLIRK